MDKNYTKEKIEEELNKPLLVVSERSLRLLLINLSLDIGIILLLIIFMIAIKNIYLTIFISIWLFFVCIDLIYNYLFKELFIFKNKIVINRFFVNNYIENIYRIMKIEEIYASKIPICLGLEFYVDMSRLSFLQKIISKTMHSKGQIKIVALCKKDRERIINTVNKIIKK